MPLTGAERSLLYRQRLKENTDKYREYLIKENKRYEKKKDIGQLKLIGDFPERQQRSRRRNWRKQKQAQRIRDADIRNILNETPTPTPPGPFPFMLIESKFDVKNMQW